MLCGQCGGVEASTKASVEVLSFRFSHSRIQCCGSALVSMRIWIRVRHFLCQCGSGSGSRSKVLMTKNWKKFTAKIKFLLIKNALYLSLGLHKGRPSYRRSLHPSKEISRTKKFELSSHLWGHFCPPESGSGSVFPMWIRILIRPSKMNGEPRGSGLGSGSTTLAELHTVIK
jgi:hypothetical protein